ncbi:MAG: hypothetical protein ACKVTZ_04640 [Bacteroidia bacterium]
MAVLLSYGCQETEKVSDGIGTDLYASSEFEVTTSAQTSYPKGKKLARVQFADESDKDPSFVDFRNRLSAAIQKKDTLFIRNMIADDAWVGKDSERSKRAFMDYYFGRFSKTHNEDFWEIMTQILRGGGKFKNVGYDSYFIAPYSAVNLLELPDNVDPFMCVAANRPNVLVYEQPDKDSRVIDTLDYEVITTEYTKSHGNWLFVHSNQDGFVNQSEVNLPVSYRCFFQKRARKWCIKYLVHGY